MDHSQLVGQSPSILGFMHAYRSLPESKSQTWR